MQILNPTPYVIYWRRQLLVRVTPSEVLVRVTSFDVLALVRQSLTTRVVRCYLLPSKSFNKVAS